MMKKSRQKTLKSLRLEREDLNVGYDKILTKITGGDITDDVLEEKHQFEKELYMVQRKMDHTYDTHKPNGIAIGSVPFGTLRP